MPRSEDGLEVDGCTVEGQPLTLMYRDRPCQADREVLEDALDVGLGIARILVEAVASILPAVGGYVEEFAILQPYDELLLGHLLDGSEHTIVEAAGLLEVVLDEHDTRADLQAEHRLDGVEVVGEVPCDAGVIVLICPREGLESLAVDLVSTGVVRRQRHVALALDGVEGGVDTSAEPLHVLGGEGAVAQVVQ